MRINNNLMAMNTHRQLGINSESGAKSIEKLSSGLRINRAGDDAAGLAISEKMRSQIRGLGQASRNAQDGISMIQTAEGALNETHAILQRMRELAVQAATDTNTADDRLKLQSEVDQLAKEVTRISNTTEFNTKNLLAGGLNNTFHIGANANQSVALAVGAMDAFSLGIAGKTVTPTIGANVAVLSAVSSAGEGLANPTYSVIVTKTAASNGAVSKGVDTGANGSDATVAGTYTGVDTASYVVRASNVVAGVVTAISVSTDGGATFGGNIAVTDNTATSIGNGLTFSITANTTGTNDVNDTWTMTATASSATARLGDAAGTAFYGAAVAIKNNASSVTIGDATADATLDISFNFATLTASATNATTVTVANVSSTAAVTNATGGVTTEAVTAAGVNIRTQAKANTSITTINSALEKVSTERSKLGAAQNRLEHTIKNLDTSAENLQASESRIRDVDMAKEMMNFTKNNILSQAAQAMLAQANQAPQGVLQLLR